MKTHVLSTILLLALATLCPAAPVDVPQDKPANTPLHAAVKDSVTDIDTLKTILESGVSIDARNQDGETALNVAAYYGNMEIVEYLVFHGADVNAAGADGRTALHFACHWGRWSAEHARFLLDLGADLDPEDNSGKTPLLRAMHDFPAGGLRAQEVVRLMITRGADVNVRDKSTPSRFPFLVPVDFDRLNRRGYNLGLTPVHYVIESAPGLFPLCVEHGANLDMTDEIGDTLVHYAAENNAVEVFEFLATHCANVHAKNNRGQTPLHMAAYRSPEIARRLVAMEADIHARDEDGWTPIFYATRNFDAQLESVKFFHRLGADVTARDNEGSTLLHIRYTCGDPDMIEYLLANGLEIDARDDAGNTPLMMLASDISGHELQWFVDHGADIHAKNHAGQSVLHTACQHFITSHNLTVLAGKGLDINARDNEGRTPLHFAMQHTLDVEALDELLRQGADPEARDACGRTAMHYVGMQRFDSQQALGLRLMELGLDINAQDDAGDTPLHETARTGNEYAVLEMLETGCDPGIRNHAGQQPVDVATGDAKRVLMEIKEMENE